MIVNDRCRCRCRCHGEVILHNVRAPLRAAKKWLGRVDPMKKKRKSSGIGCSASGWKAVPARLFFRCLVIRPVILHESLLPDKASPKHAGNVHLFPRKSERQGRREREVHFRYPSTQSRQAGGMLYLGMRPQPVLDRKRVSDGRTSISRSNCTRSLSVRTSIASPVVVSGPKETRHCCG